jgi:acyl-coenzyme A synthetase/AMP-(fatty) acid ligase
MQGRFVNELAQLCRQTLGREGPAIRFEGAWIGWAEVRRIAASLEAALDEAGIVPGTPVAFAPRNSPGSLAGFLPLLARGHVIRMVYPFQSPEALAGVLGALDCAVVIAEGMDCTELMRERLQAAGQGLIALSGEGAALVHRGAEIPTAAPPSPRIEILTSGTTGPPRHFPIGYDVVLGYARAAEAQAQTRPDPPPTLLCFPLSNISGLYALAASFLRGAPCVLLERFDVAAWRDYVVEYRPVSGGAPPAAVAMILAADIPRQDLASLLWFSTGAAPLDPAVRQAFEERYGIPVIQTYGATEFGGPVAANSPALLAQFGSAKANSVGRALPGAALRVRDPATGELAPPGTVGIVEVVSPRMGPDWIVTADLGLIDEDGFLFLHGRDDGAIMRGGFKIVPETVEQALLRHPAIAAASVVGIADPRLLEVPAAALELAADAAQPSQDELEAHVRRSLPATHVPVAWRFVEELPKTVSFKIDRRAVRALFEGADEGAASPPTSSPCR